MGWVRFEPGRPMLGGLLAGALFAAAPAAVPALILGGWAWPVTVAAVALAGAFTIRTGAAFE